MKQEMKRILMDVDTGVDDALAILYAVRLPGVRIEGITCSFGNVDARQAAVNTLNVLKLAEPDYNIPVYIGADVPLVRPRQEFSSVIHGSNGLGGYELPPSDQQPLPDHAADFIVRSANDNPGQLTLVCTGRLTNLAIALAKDPTIARKTELVLMGGALQAPGNITPVAEANIHGDPEAAARVFESGIPITMVGLDVTSQTKFGECHLERLLDKLPPQQTELRQFLSHLFSFSFEASAGLNEGRFRLLHDPLAIGVVYDPSFVTMESYYVYIETKGSLSSGATLADLRHPQSRTNANVCMAVEVERFISHFIDTLASRSEDGGDS